MLMRIREMIDVSWETYKNHFRPLTSYLFFALLLGVLFCVLFFVPLGLGIMLGGSAGIILGVVLFLALGAAGLYGAIRAVCGFELSLFKALQNKKPGTFRENFADAKPFTWKALGATFLAGLFSYFPVLAGVGGLFALQPPSFFEALRQADAMQTALPVPEIHGVLGYFFALLALYGLLHLLYFSIVFGMSLYAVLFDKKEVRESLSYSASLVQNRWWAVWWRIFALQMVLFLIYMILGIPVDVIKHLHGEAVAKIPELLLTLFMNFFVSVPLLYLPMIVLYKDLKKKPSAKK